MTPYLIFLYEFSHCLRNVGIPQRRGRIYCIDRPSVDNRPDAGGLLFLNNWKNGKIFTEIREGSLLREGFPPIGADIVFHFFVELLELLLAELPHSIGSVPVSFVIEIKTIYFPVYFVDKFLLGRVPDFAWA